MSDVTPPAGEWIASAADESVEATPATAPRTARAGWIKPAGLVVVGALVGGVAVAVSHASGGSHATRSAALGGVPGLPGGPDGERIPGGARTDGGASGGDFGGLAGEQHLTGSLTSIGSSSITVKTSAVTATYQVTPQTEILRDGAQTTLSKLKPGDAVLVHVYPSGGKSVVERLFAGQLPVPGADNGPPGFGGRPHQSDSSTSST
jgi:hypothetical protein